MTSCRSFEMVISSSLKSRSQVRWLWTASASRGRISPTDKRTVFSGRRLAAGRPVRDSGDASKPETVQKNVIVSFRRQIELKGRPPIRVLGDGGLIKVQLNNDGSLARLSKVWRSATGEGLVVKVKTPEDAQAEALKMVPNPSEYRVGFWRWGYKERSGNVSQRDMRIVYEVQLLPLSAERGKAAPPALIEIEAQ